MKIGKIFSIPIRIHWSLLVLMGAICLYDPESSLLSLTYATILFGTVLLHELGHAIVARDFGCKTSSITLYPFGGIAQVNLQKDPIKEFYIFCDGVHTRQMLEARCESLLEAMDRQFPRRD